MWTARGGHGPPGTQSGRSRRKFGALAEKKLVHMLQNPLEVHVDPAPTSGPAPRAGSASAREVREALDRGVPASRLFPYGKTLSGSDVEFVAWDERWRPVVGTHSTPRSRPAAMPPAPKRAALFPRAPAPRTAGSAPRTADSRRSRSPLGLDQSIPVPRPLPPPAYSRPTSLLKDPGSVAQNRAAKEARRKEDTRRRAHEHRLATQVAYRPPKLGEQWRVGGVQASTGQRSGTAAVMRRWSKPLTHEFGDEQHVEEEAEGGDALASSHYTLASLSENQDSWWSLISTRTWPQATTGDLEPARGEGPARDAGGDLLDQMLGSWPSLVAEVQSEMLTRSAPELSRHHASSSSLPPLNSFDEDHHQQRRKPHFSSDRSERVAAEIMGVNYTPPRDWVALGLSPRALKKPTRIMAPTPPDGAPELWQSMHSELSSHRGGLTKRANESFRGGELTDALTHLCAAIDVHSKMDVAASELAVSFRLTFCLLCATFWTQDSDKYGTESNECGSDAGHRGGDSEASCPAFAVPPASWRHKFSSRGGTCRHRSGRFCVAFRR